MPHTDIRRGVCSICPILTFAGLRGSTSPTRPSQQPYSGTLPVPPHPCPCARIRVHLERLGKEGGLYPGAPGHRYRPRGEWVGRGAGLRGAGCPCG